MSNVASQPSNGVTMKTVQAKTSAPIRQIRRLSDQVKIFAPTVRKSCIITWPGWINFVIWTIGFFIMLFLVIHNLSPLLDEYRNHNTATVLDIQTDPIPPEDITVCLPWYGKNFHEVLDRIDKMSPEYLNGTKSMNDTCELCVFLEENGYDFWNYLDGKFVSVEGYIKVGRFVVDKLRLDNYTPIINRTNHIWVQFMVDALKDYLYRLTMMDKYTLEGNGEWNIFPLNMSNADLDDLNGYFLKSIELSINSGCVLKEKTIVFSQTNQSIDYWGMRINSKDVNSSTRHPLKLTTITNLWQSICFHLPIRQFGIKEFKCSYSRWPYTWDRHTETVFEIYQDPDPMYTNVERKDVNAERKDALYSTAPAVLQSNQSHVYEHIKLQYCMDGQLIAEKPNQPKPCLNESSVDKCVIKNQVNRAIHKCRCVPFTFRHFYSSNLSLPYCAIDHYSKCMQDLADSFDRYKDECNNLCNYTFYDWRVQSNIDRYEDNPEYPQFMVQIVPAKKPYTQFGFKIQTTPEQFMASVGGLINLYIGGSGLTLFALLILCMEQTKQWLFMKKNNPDQQNNTVVGWQTLRMFSIFHMLGQKHQQETNDQNLEMKVQDLEKEVHDLKCQLKELMDKKHNKRRAGSEKTDQLSLKNI